MVRLVLGQQDEVEGPVAFGSGQNEKMCIRDSGWNGSKTLGKKGIGDLGSGTPGSLAGEHLARKLSRTSPRGDRIKPIR